MKKWSLQQVVLLAFLAFLFGGVFMGAGFLYALLNAALLPLGLGPFANELLFGMWTMVAPIAAMLIPVTRSVLGKAFGPIPSSVPLSIVAIAIFARLVEQVLLDVPEEIYFLPNELAKKYSLFCPTRRNRWDCWEKWLWQVHVVTFVEFNGTTE